MDFNFDKLTESPALPGVIGAIVGLKWSPGITWKERFFNAVCGTSMAVFLAPAIAQYFKLNSPEMQSATIFFTGLFGLNLAATGFRWLSTIQLADLLPWRSGKKD